MEAATASPVSQDSGLLVGRVTHVTDPSNFWIQIGTRELLDRFADLEVGLHEFGEGSETLVSDGSSNLEGGTFVVARTKFPKVAYSWRRAQIARHVDKETVDVFYIDYGTTEIVSLGQLCCSVPDFFFAVNHQAWRCGLAGIRPIAKTWTSRGIKCFQRLTSNVDLQTAIISYQTPSLCLTHQLALYTSEDSGGRSLAHLMLEEETGMPDDIDRVAEYARDVTQAYPDSYNDPQGFYSDEDTHSRDIGEMSGDDSSPTTRSSAGMPTNQSPESSHVTPEPSEPRSPEIMIPKFNLNSLFKTKMASADAIKEKKEDARRKAVTMEMEKDLQDVENDIEEHLKGNELIDWGASDYDIGRKVSAAQVDVYTDKVAAIREAIGDKSWSPSLTEGMGPQKPVLQQIKAEDRIPQGTQRCDFPSLTSTSNSTEIANAPHMSTSDGPTVTEKLESQLSKQLSKILDDGDLEDPGALCDQFNKIVHPDKTKEPWGLSITIEVLLETAVVVPSSHHNNIFSVLDSYCDSLNFDIRLETELHRLESRFVKPSFGKTSSYHKEFGHVLGQLFIMSRLWNSQAADTTKQIVFKLMEKWAIYNRYGHQLGVQSDKTQQMFLDCLEGLWSSAGETVKEINPSVFSSVQSWLKDKVLATTHPPNIREQVLRLLLCIGQVTVFQADQVKPRTSSVEVQTELSFLHLPDDEDMLTETRTEDHTIFSHFTSEIEDTSPVVEDAQHRAESSPVPHTKRRTESLEYVPDTACSQTAAVSTLASSEGPNQFGSWADCVSRGALRSRKTSEKSQELPESGLKALALQTMNGEKYVFSGRFAKDLPPRFRKHLDDNQSGILQDGRTRRKKNRKDFSPGLDYQTPKNESEGSQDIETTAEIEKTRTNSSVSDFKTGGDYLDSRKSSETEYGVEEMNILRQERLASPTDGFEDRSTKSTSGTESDTQRSPVKESVSTDECVSPHKTLVNSKMNSRKEYQAKEFLRHSPVDWWNVGESHTVTKPNKCREKSRTPSPKPIAGNHEKKSPSPTPISLKSIFNPEKMSKSPSPKPSLNPKAPEWVPGKASPVSVSSKTRHDSFSSSKESLSSRASNSHSSQSTTSIKSIVMDIFGGAGDGDKEEKRSKTEKLERSEESEAEKPVAGDAEPETDGANTSFCISEIASELEDNPSTADPLTEVSSSKLLNHLVSACPSGYGFDDNYSSDDDYDGFMVSGVDEPFQDYCHETSQSSCVDTGVIEGERTDSKSTHNENCSKLDFMKPMPGPQPPKKEYSWVPGKRKCTKCGSVDHTVYSCTTKKSMLF